MRKGKKCHCKHKRRTVKRGKGYISDKGRELYRRAKRAAHAHLKKGKHTAHAHLQKHGKKYFDKSVSKAISYAKREGATRGIKL